MWAGGVGNGDGGDPPRNFVVLLTGRVGESLEIVRWGQLLSAHGVWASAGRLKARACTT